MDTHARTLAKCATWQISGLIIMTAIGYLLTGSMATGGAVAIAGTATGCVTFVVHERIWARVRWGRRFSPDN